MSNTKPFAVVSSLGCVYSRSKSKVGAERIAARLDKERPSDGPFTVKGPKPAFYSCGICEHLHPATWNGDCREDANRFAADDLDAKHGADGWQEVPMPGTASPDFTINIHGSLVLIKPRSEACRKWLRANTDGTWWAGGLAVEPRFVADLVAGMAADGFTQ